MMSTSDRGKWSETEVRKVLKKMESDFLNFTFNRIPDARAGSAVTVPGDFQAFYKETDDLVGHSISYNFLMEVKELAKGSRLPYKNFAVDSIARAHKRELAGSQVVILVCCKERKTWWLLPLSFFRQRNVLTPSGSWDLAGRQSFDNKDLYAKLLEEFGL
jgi:hypothetical protein